MENEIVRLSQEEFKKALKSQIDAIGVDDHVILNMCFEKLPGSSIAEKHIDIEISKCSGVDEHDEE
jgi:hypothetical protein